MRVLSCLALLVLVSCGGSKKPSATSTTPTKESHVAPDVGLLAVQQARCSACHSLSGELDSELRAGDAGPLAAYADRVDEAASLPALSSHYSGFGLSDKQAADVRAWMRSLGGERTPRNFADVSGGTIARGEQLVRELGCGACHAPAQLDLSAVTDHAQLQAFLASPERAGKSIPHVPLSGTEAGAIAAYLLRSQQQEGARAAGFGFQYFELKIQNGDWPDVTGLQPKKRGAVQKIDTSVAARKQNYALLFEATLDVPEDGEWNFATRSDDGSWLWIDGELVVDNPGLKPATRKDGRVNLSKGAHELRVAFTQGGGGAELKVLWSGPGVEEQELPGERAATSVVRLVPKPIVATPPDAEAVARGRAAARAARCNACHQVDDPAFDELPAPPAAKAWSALKAGEGTCQLPAGRAVFSEVGSCRRSSNSRRACGSR